MRFSSMFCLPWSEALYSMPSSMSSRRSTSVTPGLRIWYGSILSLTKEATFIASGPSARSEPRWVRRVEAVSCTEDVSTRRAA